METIDVDIEEPYAQMLEEITEENGEEVVMNDLKRILQNAIHESY